MKDPLVINFTQRIHNRGYSNSLNEISLLISIISIVAKIEFDKIDLDRSLVMIDDITSLENIEIILVIEDAFQLEIDPEFDIDSNHGYLTIDHILNLINISRERMGVLDENAS